MTPNNREELVELINAAIDQGSGDDCGYWVLKALDANGLVIVPEKPSFGLDKMTGAGADKLPAVTGVFGYAGQLAANVYTAMLSASPFRKDG